MKIKFIYLPSTVVVAKSLKRAINWLEAKKQQQRQQQKKKKQQQQQWNLYVDASLQTPPPPPLFFHNLSSIVGRFSCKRPLDTCSDVYVRARGMYYTTQRTRQPW